MPDRSRVLGTREHDYGALASGTRADKVGCVAAFLLGQQFVPVLKRDVITGISQLLDRFTDMVDIPVRTWHRHVDQREIGKGQPVELRAKLVNCLSLDELHFLM